MSLFGSQPLGNGDGMLHHLALDDGADDIAKAGVLLERIFTGLQIRPGPQRKHAADKGPAVVVDHSLALQDVGDVGHAGTRRNVDHLVLLQRSRRFDLLLAVDVEAAAADHGNQDDGEYRVTGDHQRIAGPIGTLRRRRDLLGLQRGTRTPGRNGRPFTHRCNLNPVGSIVAGQCAPADSIRPRARCVTECGETVNKAGAALI